MEMLIGYLIDHTVRFYLWGVVS